MARLGTFFFAFTGTGASSWSVVMAVEYQPCAIEQADPAEIKAAVATYEAIVVTALDAILDRYGRNPEYPFIDTKFDRRTGEDFPAGADAAEARYGRDIVYNWVQGRGLEALCAHAAWLPECSFLGKAEQGRRVRRIRTIVERVLGAMEPLRERNGGRLPFMMRTDGTPLRVCGDGTLAPLDELPGRSGFADIFYAKGMIAASKLLDRADLREEATAYFHGILDNIRTRRFASNQQQFDVKTPTGHQPGRRSQAYRMIALGGLALFYKLTREEKWLRTGEEFVLHLLENHVNHGQFADLREYDFVEHLTDDGEPWKNEDGAVVTDPGHTLEFVGLSLKLLLPMKKRVAAGKARREERELVHYAEEVMPRLFRHNFQLGFNREGEGIYKTVDLLKRRPLNSDMPWWNLPESMRAALELMAFKPDADGQAALRRAFADCSNALLRHYINPKAHLTAVQTRNKDGEVVNVIPGAPDGDPAYHTGLSIIDCIRLIRTLF